MVTFQDFKQKSFAYCNNKLLVITVSVTVLVIVMAWIYGVFLPASFPGQGNTKEVKFRVSKGDSVIKVSQALAEEGIVASPFAFRAYAILSGRYDRIQAGLYAIPPKSSIDYLTTIFHGGLALSEDIVITIFEGSNINDIDKKFALAGLTKLGDFIDPETTKSEGFLFPDTYRFLPGTTKEEIIKTLRDNFDAKTKEVWGDRIFSSRELQEIIIKASIIEKEVRIEKDMKLVASVIDNRLKINKPLQIDATVAYGVCREDFLVGKNCETSQVNLVKAIREQSSFNSYKNKNLPPAPIANPGLQSIRAVLSPAKSDYFYYLTGRDGITRFSKTAAEHEANRIKYLIGN